MQARLLGNRRKRRARTNLENSSTGDEDNDEENDGPAVVLRSPLAPHCAACMMLGCFHAFISHLEFTAWQVVTLASCA